MRLVAVVAALLGGCIEAELTICGGAIACPSGFVCDDVGGCVLPEQITACASAESGAACSFPGVDIGACTNGYCRPVGCGNRVVTFDEACDDGNTINGDGCSADCRSAETCGNGIVDVAMGEQCDDGNDDDGDMCHRHCLYARCGDGILDPQLSEQCDNAAANANLPDACRPNCTLPRCADGVLDVNSGEKCDDGNARSGDGCAADCLSDETCGNAVIDLVAGETCDDSNVIGGDGCSANCQSLESCGNGIVDTTEACDSFNQLTLTCDPDCTLPSCGDGIRNQAAGEECDDQNPTSGDGCDAHCRNEICGNGRLEDNEECDDNNQNTTDSCPACEVARCGDGFRQTGVDQCDDGNVSNTDGCLNTCMNPTCGDGFVRVGVETCEDGNGINTDGCVACQTARCGDSFVRTGFELCDDGNIVDDSNGCSSSCGLTSFLIYSDDLSPGVPGTGCEIAGLEATSSTVTLAFQLGDLVFPPSAVDLRVSFIGTPAPTQVTLNATDTGILTFSESTCMASPGTIYSFSSPTLTPNATNTITLDGVSGFVFLYYPSSHIGELFVHSP